MELTPDLTIMSKQFQRPLLLLMPQEFAPIFNVLLNAALLPTRETLADAQEELEPLLAVSLLKELWLMLSVRRKKLRKWSITTRKS